MKKKNCRNRTLTSQILLMYRIHNMGITNNTNNAHPQENHNIIYLRLVVKPMNISIQISINKEIIVLALD